MKSRKTWQHWAPALLGDSRLPTRWGPTCHREHVLPDCRGGCAPGLPLVCCPALTGDRCGTPIWQLLHLLSLTHMHRCEVHSMCLSRSACLTSVWSLSCLLRASPRCHPGLISSYYQLPQPPVVWGPGSVWPGSGRGADGLGAEAPVHSTMSGLRGGAQTQA